MPWPCGRHGGVDGDGVHRRGAGRAAGDHLGGEELANLELRGLPAVGNRSVSRFEPPAGTTVKRRSIEWMGADAPPRTYRLDGVEVMVFGPTRFGGRTAIPLAVTSRWVGSAIVTQLRSLNPEMATWVSMHLSNDVNVLSLVALHAGSGAGRTTRNVFVTVER